MNKGKSTPTKKKKNRQPGCTWSDEDSELFIKLLVQQKAKGATSENGFKDSVYTEVVIALEAK